MSFTSIHSDYPDPSAMDANFPFDDTDSSILSSAPRGLLAPTVQSTPDEIGMTCS